MPVAVSVGVWRPSRREVHIAALVVIVVVLGDVVHWGRQHGEAGQVQGRDEGAVAG